MVIMNTMMKKMLWVITLIAISTKPIFSPQSLTEESRQSTYLHYFTVDGDCTPLLTATDRYWTRAHLHVMVLH